MKLGINYTKHIARRITCEDYKKFDYIIGMEKSNIKNIKKIIGNDNENKIYMLLDFTENSRDIADPWYTGNFEKTFNDIKEGIEGFFNYLNRGRRICLKKI